MGERVSGIATSGGIVIAKAPKFHWQVRSMYDRMKWKK